MQNQSRYIFLSVIIFFLIVEFIYRGTIYMCGKYFATNNVFFRHARTGVWERTRALYTWWSIWAVRGASRRVGGSNGDWIMYQMQIPPYCPVPPACSIHLSASLKIPLMRYTGFASVHTLNTTRCPRARKPETGADRLLLSWTTFSVLLLRSYPISAPFLSFFISFLRLATRHRSTLSQGRVCRIDCRLKLKLECWIWHPIVAARESVISLRKDMEIARSIRYYIVSSYKTIAYIVIRWIA